MSKQAATDLYTVITKVRTCFNLLKSLSEHLLNDFAVNPSMRAVLEALATKGTQTVPEIANAKGVSRQHIQVNMNALKDLGLVNELENPAHKRSVLYELTDLGSTTFKQIREMEIEPIARIANQLPAEQLPDAAALLEQFNQTLINEINKGKPT